MMTVHRIAAALLALMLALGSPVQASAMADCPDSTAAMASMDTAGMSEDCGDTGGAPLHRPAVCHAAYCMAAMLFAEMHQPSPHDIFAAEVPQALVIWQGRSPTPEPRPPSIFLHI